ncbi:hypothetical protein [Actinomadura latina]|uniref:Uncharacterized protein n=1 Tax=Actinomadura latina TaxID=163603 RepID=A0A846ZAT0_9ACTN|nr:hypothetical protein [Actinomadura latina]NKZ08827.1 hypothetical protein [Actinomadura latina]
MSIEQSGRTDTRTEDAEHPQGPDRPPAPPPDRPGQPGQPSRLDSLRAAREYQAARAAEQERQRTAAPENGTEPPEAPDEEAVESSPAEPTGEQQNDQEGPEETEAADEARESSTGLGERDAARPEPEADEELRPDESEAQLGAAETGELPPETDAGQSGSDQDGEAEPLSDEDAVEEPDPPAEAEAAEDSPDPRDAEPEADQAGRPDGPGEDQRAQNSGNQDAGETPPQPLDERDRPESRDHPQLPQQDGHLSGTGGPGSEIPAGQILQADSQPGLQEQASQDVPGPVPAGQPEGSSDVQPPSEGDTRRTADGQFTPAESSEQSGITGNGMAWPMEPEEGVTRWASPVVQFGEGTPGTRVENRDRNAEGQPEAPTSRLDDNAIREKIDPFRPDTDNAEGEKEDFKRTVREADGEWTDGVDRIEDLPTGEKLAEGNPEKKSRADKFRQAAYQDYSRIDKQAKNYSKTIADAFGPHPPGQAVTRANDGPVISNPPQSGIDAGSMASSLLATGIVLAELTRWGVRKIREEKTE